VFRSFKTRIGKRREPSQELALGHLEAGVMDVLWARGECAVRDVMQALPRPLAYTTVMTTLDRLFKKGLLGRNASRRAFVYAPRLSREEWERRQAESFVSGFLTRPRASRDLLFSFLLDSVGERDAELLDDLEKKIRGKRKELLRRSRP